MDTNSLCHIGRHTAHTSQYISFASNNKFLTRSNIITVHGANVEQEAFVDGCAQLHQGRLVLLSSFIRHRPLHVESHHQLWERAFINTGPAMAGDTELDRIVPMQKISDIILLFTPRDRNTLLLLAEK